MKKLFTPLAMFLVAFTITTSAVAQSWGFAQYGNWAYDVAQGPDGNYWATGYGGELPDWADVTAGYIVKLDANGEKIWAGPPAGLPLDYYSANNILPTEDGGAAVYVSSTSPEMYKVNAGGDLIWTTDTWDGDAYIYGGQAAQLTDGRTIIGGLTDFQHSFYEVDATGALLSTWIIAPDTGAAWTWSYWDYKETGITATADGGFAYTTGNGANKIVYKYNSDLELEWSSYIPWEMPWEYGYQNALKTTSDGGYLLCGSGTDLTGDYYGTARKLAADGSVEWFNALNHGSYWEEGGWGVELPDGNYIVWTQDGGESSTAGWILDGATGVETGSIFIPVMGAIGGFAETGMEIFDVETTADGGYLLAGRMWLEDFDQRFTVIKSNADGTFDDCIFNCVWPGDANNDGYANGSDLFEIGINFGATGTPRADMSIDWEGKLAQAWNEPDSMFWFILNDLKWTDCDGSGTINDDDTTAVINNLGLDHPLNNVRLEGGEAPLYFAPDADMLSIGLNEIPIMLGDEITGVDDIYGITFTINIDADVIDAASLKIDFDDSWIGNVGETLRLSKTFGDTKQVVGTIVRKDRVNTSGDGQIGTLSIVVVDNISGKTDAEEVEMSFSGVTAIKIDREVIPVAAATLTISAEENTYVDNTIAEGITVYPNPANEVIYIDNTTGEQIVSISISDITGKIIYENNNPAGLNNVIDISSLLPGNYFMEINNGKSIISQSISIQ